MDLPGRCQAGGTECTSEKAEDDQNLQTLGTATSSVKRCERCESRTEHDASTKYFGAWCPDQWAYYKAEDETGCDCASVCESCDERYTHS